MLNFYGLSDQVVTAADATAGPGESIPLYNLNHKSICKPATVQDELVNLLVGFIKKKV